MTSRFSKTSDNKTNVKKPKHPLVSLIIWLCDFPDLFKGFSKHPSINHKTVQLLFWTHFGALFIWYFQGPYGYITISLFVFVYILIFPISSIITTVINSIFFDKEISKGTRENTDDNSH